MANVIISSRRVSRGVRVVTIKDVGSFKVLDFEGCKRKGCDENATWPTRICINHLINSTPTNLK